MSEELQKYKVVRGISMHTTTLVRVVSGAGHVIELANGAYNCARIVLLHRMCINQETTTEEA